MANKTTYESNPLYTLEDMNAALESDDPELIGRALLLRTGDQKSIEYPTSLIRRFGKHPDAGVRDACLIGISIVLMTHGRFDAELAAELIELGLNDQSDTVYSNAMAALEDMEGQPDFPPPGYEHLLEFLEDFAEEETQPVGGK